MNRIAIDHNPASCECNLCGTACVCKKCKMPHRTPKWHRARTKNCTCPECDGICADYYMLLDSVWAQVRGLDRFLHLECVEKRLGRKLTRADFSEAPVNDWIFWIMDRAHA